MRFRGDTVWVRVDGTGRPVLDSGGRAEMKYRESDSRTYRPGSANLSPFEGDATVLADAPAKPKTQPAPRTLRSKPAAPPASSQDPKTKTEVIHVWTDGACSGNPGPMGIGVVLIAGARRREHGEYLGVGTNNIAELVAIERGLEFAAEEGGVTAPVRLHTDSAYSIGVLSKGWKAKANQELIARIRERLAAHHQVQLIKVAGHAGIPENERCDELARDAVLTRSGR